MKFVLVFLTIFLSSCTSALWDAKASYNENITGFHLVDGKLQVLAVGDKYSYLFDIDENLFEALNYSRQVEFTLGYNRSILYSDNKISSHFNLSVNLNDLSEFQIKKLNGLQFQTNESNSALYLRSKINGTRYITEGNPPVTIFENGYVIEIEVDEDNTLRHGGKVLLTPAAISFDALVTFPVFVLAFTIADITGQYP